MKKLLSILILMLALALPGYSQIPPPPAAVPDPLPEIEKIEYFFDTDPGFGYGIDVPIIADSIVDKNFSIDISGLDVGRHLVYFRSRDENGRWTLNHVEHINKAAPAPMPASDLPDIVALEYFYNSDPGFGSGTSVYVAADSIVDKNFSIDISGLDVGRHLVYFRSRDENGRWTLNHVEHINKAVPAPESAGPLPDIVALEYFYDTDPGYGNGIPVIPILQDSIVDKNFNLDVTGLDLGRHLVYFRTRDENGRWTLNHVEHINKAVPSPESAGPLPDIVALEYFYDTDPGYGNGIPVIPILQDSIVDKNFNLDMSSLDLGRHLVYFRTRDENGRWTLAHVEQLDKLVPESESAVPLPDIVAMEYFFDTDPGFGNGIDIPVLDPDSLVDIDFKVDVSSWGTEVHILYVRALDELGRWSLVYLEPLTKGDISRRMRHGKFFFNGIEQPMFTEDKPD